jgi:hypothetical protein
MKHQIAIEIDDAELARYTNQRLALAWHVAQANPAGLGDPFAGELAEHIGREMIRRWLRSVLPELWHHQGRHYSWSWLRKFACYEPPAGVAAWDHERRDWNPEFRTGRWVPRGDREETS